MNLLKHLLILLVLDAGAVMAFGDDEPAPAASLPLCSTPAASALPLTTDTGSTFTRTPTEHVHEN